MDRLKHLSLLLAIITTTVCFAQKTVSVDETVFIHANATTFVTGETLMYKIYCLKTSDDTPSVISKIAYVEIIDNTNNLVYKDKIALEKSCGQGDYFIPTTLKTGNYKLIAYTNWMLNKNLTDFFQIDLTIINPYNTAENSNTDSTSINNEENSNKENTVKSSSITLDINKKSFNKRERVDLRIKAMDSIFKKGSYSLSVRKIDSLPTVKQTNASKFVSKKESAVVNLENSTNTIHIPELRGEMISGKITAKNNVDKIENLTIGLSITGKNFVFKTAKTDATGAFKIFFNKANYNTDITVQIIDNKESDYTLTIEKPYKIDYTKLSFPTFKPLSSTIREGLIARSVASQIENAYYTRKTDSIKTVPFQPSFFTPTTKEYILDDYTRFSTLKETIIEVATDLYSKQEENQIYLHVNDPSIYPQNPEAALVLIDGLFVKNQKELFDYKTKNIYKIEIIVGPYYFGSKFYNGLVCLSSFGTNYKSSQSDNGIINTTILRPLPQKKYRKVDYSNPAINERIPDYRYQLLWLPDSSFENKENLISFYTSDVTGTFEISIEGFTEKGTPISEQMSFEVK